jgi:hypothetical protein
MKRYRVVDNQGAGFMQDTEQEPLTINELRGRFWGLDENHTENFKDFTANYIQDTWQVDFIEVKGKNNG